MSGEEIAEKLNCTRGAIWKAVKALQQEGYEIHAVTNRGYCLAESTDVLSEEAIGQRLEKKWNIQVEVVPVIDSTNRRAKELASEGAPEGTLIVASQQTKGKGRMNRQFYSPADTGLYMSLVLRPNMQASQAVRITTAAAVAVAEAIEKIAQKETQIKWVNDVYIENRKVCGILTEAAFSIEDYGFDYAVLGIGVNVYEPEGGFAEEIQDIAGAVLKEKKGSARNDLVAEIINGFYHYYKEIEEATYHTGYEKRLMWKGEKINILSGDASTPATLVGVDADCRLQVQYDNGDTDSIGSGEISIRKS